MTYYLRQRKYFVPKADGGMPLISELSSYSATTGFGNKSVNDAYTVLKNADEASGMRVTTPDQFISKYYKDDGTFNQNRYDRNLTYSQNSKDRRNAWGLVAKAVGLAAAEGLVGLFNVAHGTDGVAIAGPAVMYNELQKRRLAEELLKALKGTSTQTAPINTLTTLQSHEISAESLPDNTWSDEELKQWVLVAKIGSQNDLTGKEISKDVLDRLLKIVPKNPANTELDLAFSTMTFLPNVSQALGTIISLTPTAEQGGSLKYYNKKERD